MRKAQFICIIVMSMAILAGCKTPSLQDRMRDGAEIFRLNVGLGPGLLVNAQVTRAIELGAGTYEARRFGFRNGHGWIWDERRYDMNLLVPIWGWSDVPSVLRGGMPRTYLYGDQHDRLPPGEEPGFWGWAEMPLTINDKTRGWFEVALNVHVLFIGVDAGVDFGELVDWTFGWFGLDLAGDDSNTGAKLEKHTPPLPPPPGEPFVNMLH